EECEGTKCWNGPRLSTTSASSAMNAATAVRPWARGAPLHIINTTVNETLDARTKVQNQDRKGTGLALGPCGVSLGIRHHLVTDHSGHPAIFPAVGYRVFRSAGENGRTPEPLSYGRCTSTSTPTLSSSPRA